MFASLALLAVGLSADAFAVAITQGAAVRQHPWRAALVVALAFGAAQAIAPLMGWSLGFAFAGLIEAWDHWIAFALLAAIGARMIWEGNRTKDEKDIKQASGWGLLALAVATSIDAAAAGITLPTLGVPVGMSVAAIGAVTFALCFAGVWIGRAGSRVLGPNAEIIGGLILIVIGAKVLIDHRAFDW
jgi:putative Mn2+ efflux pump MntP